MADHFTPTPVRAPLTRVPLSEPATLDACRRDYADGKAARDALDRYARRFFVPASARADDPDMDEALRRVRAGGTR